LEVSGSPHVERMRLKCLSQLAPEPLWREGIEPADLAKACEVRIDRDERRNIPLASHLFLIKRQLELDVTLSHSGVYEDRAGQ
jgi:hypothetical protein